MNFYTTQPPAIQTPPARPTAEQDPYRTLMPSEQDGSTVTLRAIVEPTVAWVWIGGLLVMIGGFSAAFARPGPATPRTRRPAGTAPAATAATHPEPDAELEEATV